MCFSYKYIDANVGNLSEKAMAKGVKKGSERYIKKEGYLSQTANLY